jgi:hypothetical protein
MKKILSFLLSVVFLHAQTAPLLAKRGGPDIGNEDTANVDIVGTYSGSLIPEDPESAGTPSLDGEFINSLGLFSLGMPDTGPGTGSFVIFTQGFTFSGTITAVGDPGKSTVNGLVEGSYQFQDFLLLPDGSVAVDENGVPIIQTFTAVVTGTLFANVVQTAEFNPADPSTISFQRLEGNAQLGVILPGGVTNRTLNYIVDGVKQSPEVAGNTGGLAGGGFVLLL